jgi:Bacterial regulatory protein, Fis family
MNALPDPQARGDIVGYHGAVSDFKRRLIESTLHQARGNRTHAARTLGLQRTYLLRLIRELQVAAPPPPSRNGRTSPAPSAAASAPADARVPAPVATSPAPPSAAAQPPSPRSAPPTPRAAASAFYPPARPPAQAPARRVPRR